LLSTPVIVGAALLELPQISWSQINGPFIVGFFTSALVGFLSIKFLLSFLKTKTLFPFVIYRLALAGLILAVSL